MLLGEINTIWKLMFYDIYQLFVTGDNKSNAHFRLRESQFADI